MENETDEQREAAARNTAVAAVVEKLFTNGSGEVADRLVLMQDPDKRNLGGWSRQPIADRLDEIFNAGIAYERARNCVDDDSWLEDALIYLKAQIVPVVPDVETK